MDDFYLQKWVELATQVRCVLHGFPKLCLNHGRKVSISKIVGKRCYFILFHMEHGIGRIPAFGTGISRYRHPVPSSDTGSVLEASSTAPELPFKPIPIIQNWMTVLGTGYR